MADTKGKADIVVLVRRQGGRVMSSPENDIVMGIKDENTTLCEWISVGPAHAFAQLAPKRP